MKINHLDLFSGVGVFSLALERAIGKEDIGWIGYSDIDKYANQVFKRRFPNAEGLGSITDVQPDNLPERIDLITFGSPCQDFSIAGKRGGISANRSSLLFEAMRIIRAKKPKYFVFENVKGLFSSGGGEDFTIVLQEIADSGYDGQWELLNSRHYGVPQNRERIYFVGHIRGRGRPEVFPLRETSEKPDIRDAEVASTLQHPGHSGGNYKGMNMVKVHCTQTRNPNRPSLTKKCDCASGKLYQKCCGAGGGSGLISKDDGTTYCLDTGNTQAVEIKELNKNQQEKWDKYDVDSSVSGTITEAFGRGGSSAEYVKMLKKNKEITGQIRRLTPVECSRLQGFPDDWNDCCSDSQRYKQMGNSITVNVAEAIFRKLYKERGCKLEKK